MTLAIPDVIRLHPDDNVVIALKDLGSGAVVPEVPVPLADPVPRGHKIAAGGDRAGGERDPLWPDHRGGDGADRGGRTMSTPTTSGMGAHEQDYAFATEARALPLPRASRASSWAITAPTAASARATTSAS